MLRVGELFSGRFRVDREVAAGGMGVVYEVLDTRSNRPRALKVMQGHLVRDAKKRESFAREAMVGSTIESDHVVEVIDLGVDEASGLPWILMELLRGETLEERVRREGALPPVEVARLFRHLGHALGSAHRKGVLHLDLKPANLFLAQPKLEGGGSVLKVLDFGIARMVEAGRTSAELTSQGGTLAWMAPEQSDEGERVKPAVDVWPLGLVAFYLLTGKEYWKNQNLTTEPYSARKLLREVTVDPKPPASQRARELGVGGRLPEGFDAWFAKCVCDAPEERWKDANEAIPALLRLLPEAGAGSGVPVTPTPVPSPPKYQPTAPLGGTPLPPSGMTSVAAPPSEALRRAPERAREMVTGNVWGTKRVLGVGAGAVGLAVVGALWVFGRNDHVVATPDAGAVTRDAGGAPNGGGVVTVRDDDDVPSSRACVDETVAIPGGEFDMGDANGENGRRVHRVRVSPFRMDTTEVSVACFREFWAAGHPAPTGAVQYPGGALPWRGAVTEPVARSSSNAWCNWSSSAGAYEQHPINCVNWHTMQAYCAWRGGRLPTEAEWEFAARGTDGRIFPWGSTAPDQTRGNFCGVECGRAHSGWSMMPGVGDDSFPETAPVGSFLAGNSPFGVKDMAGNVWEWVADGYRDYRSNSGTNIPVDPLVVDGTSRVLRGGSWGDYGVVVWARAGSRGDIFPGNRYVYWGARCARGGS